MSRKSSDSKRYYDWVFRAKLDYFSARKLMEDSRLKFSVAFHCQQCIEKALKGYLLYKNHKLYDGHNLTWLCRQAVNVDEHFRDWLDESATLNRYYIETRYPADKVMQIDEKTINSLVKMTGDMLDFICGQISFDFDRYRQK